MLDSSAMARPVSARVRAKWRHAVSLLSARRVARRAHRSGSFWPGRHSGGSGLLSAAGHGLSPWLNLAPDELEALDISSQNAIKLMMEMGREDPGRLMAVRSVLSLKDANDTPVGAILVGRVSGVRLVEWASRLGWRFDAAGMKRLRRAAEMSGWQGAVSGFVAEAVLAIDEPPHDYHRYEQEGHVLTARTLGMLKAAAQVMAPPSRLAVIKGSYVAHICRGAHPHLGGGAVDLLVTPNTEQAIVDALAQLRRAGFAAWIRERDAEPHIHAIAIGDRELSPAARWQVHSFFQGRDGRCRSGPDPHIDLDASLPRWTLRYGVGSW